MDKLSKEHRSWNMSRIRSRNTRPEMVVRSLLHKAGFRFRLHVKGLPGTPDIVLPKYRMAIFVHGCFWHRHPGCRYAYMPTTRRLFWKNKFARNVARDRLARRQLEAAGWRVLIIWECQAEGPHRPARQTQRGARRGARGAPQRVDRGVRCPSGRRWGAELVKLLRKLRHDSLRGHRVKVPS